MMSAKIVVFPLDLVLVWCGWTLSHVTTPPLASRPATSLTAGLMSATTLRTWQSNAVRNQLS